MSDNDAFFRFSGDNQETINEIKRMGQEIRELKQLALEQTDDAGTITTDTRIAILVSTMDKLKDEVSGVISERIHQILGVAEKHIRDGALESVSPLVEEAKCLCNLLPSGKVKKNSEKRLKAIQKSRDTAVSAKFDTKLHTEGLRIQRKIHHLLESEGSGDDFIYLPDRLATELHGLVENDQDHLVVLTEKWDGTTVQATNKGIFKRSEKLRKGDPRKFGANEADRYDITRLDIGFDEFLLNRERAFDVKRGKGSHASRYIREACEKYFPAFASLSDDLCVYFEAVGTNIQARYKGVGSDAESWHDIRVFDFARNGRFLPWREVCSLTKELGLPLVGHTDPAPLNLKALLADLASEPCYKVNDHPAGSALLEGYVVRGVSSLGRGERDEEAIAKIRVEDLEFFAATGDSINR